MFPEKLVEKCIRIGSKPGDTVLDCFAGSGTAGLVAQQMGRSAILLDISEDYVRLMKQRVEGKGEYSPRAFADYLAPFVGNVGARPPWARS
jgi:DNA modification methylase